MTREEAIKILEQRFDSSCRNNLFQNVEKLDYEDALWMAIPALRSVSREQVEMAWRGEWGIGGTEMTDREKMIDLIINAKRTDPETGSFTEYLADFLLGCGIKLPTSTPQPGKPLTLEQLREMQGEKVILYRMKSTEPLETGTVKENGDVLGDAGMLAYHELYLETWVAFSIPFVRIDRSEWTAEWIYPENEWNLPRCSKCGCNSKDATYGHKSNFCPKCGRAMTEEAWAELERRLMG